MEPLETLSSCAPTQPSYDAAYVEGENRQYVTFRVAEQLFGVDIAKVQDVLNPRNITAIPSAPEAVAGVLNLRGRIVTAINVRVRLGLTHDEKITQARSIVVEKDGHLYSLLVDKVGDVFTLPVKEFVPTPENIPTQWRELLSGVYQLLEELMVVVNVDHLLRFSHLPETEETLKQRTNG